MVDGARASPIMPFTASFDQALSFRQTAMLFPTNSLLLSYEGSTMCLQIAPFQTPQTWQQTFVADTIIEVEFSSLTILGRLLQYLAFQIDACLTKEAEPCPRDTGWNVDRSITFPAASYSKIHLHSIHSLHNLVSQWRYLERQKPIAETRERLRGR
jgi:hypothetical protein